MSDTVLVITGAEITPYSARGLTQTLQPIAAAASLRRTVNGTLVDLSVPEFRKYASQISCDDMAVPALDGIWPGQEVTVDCVAELSYRTAGGTAARPVVAGSSYTEGDFTFYRPQLTMRIIAFDTRKDEWGAVVGWQMQLEES